MADDFTCILRDEFKRFIEELPYEELRQSIFTEELEVADRFLALSEMICREFVFFLCIFESRNCDLRLRNAKPRPSSWPCIAFVDGFGLASNTIVITVFLKPIYALSIPLSSTFAQFKELFDQLSYVLTDITVPRLKDAKENTNSRQILSERASNLSATSNSSVKVLCLNSS